MDGSHVFLQVALRGERLATPVSDADERLFTSVSAKMTLKQTIANSGVIAARVRAAIASFDMILLVPSKLQ